MSKYENLTIEQLIEQLEERDESIEDMEAELDEVKVERDDLSASLSSMEDELIDSEDKEQFMERSYNAGFEACENNEEQMRSWLNFKIGERI